MKRKLLFTTLALISGIFAFSQDKDDSKIVVEITKEINGEKKTFRGEYETTEQMKSDPNYQEFAGDDTKFNFWFDKDGDEDVFFHMDQFDNFSNSFSFDFGMDDEEKERLLKRFHFDDQDGSGFFLLDDMDLDEYKDRLKELGIEMEGLVERLKEKGGHRAFIITKRIKVSDIEGDEFGKKGTVNKNNILELENLSFSPNPSSDGRFRIRFQVPKEDEMNIKVYNTDGKEVFNRYFERFGGTYSETIDLSDQKDGIYLLEISQGNQRLTKKIIIN